MGMSDEPDVLVVGAGVAGIAAARALRARGLSCLILEAKDRIFGRAYNDSTGFDHGASWLYQANDNPLTAFAETLGFEVVDHDLLRQRLLFTEGRFATFAERKASAMAEDHFWRVVEAAAANGAPDRPASDATPQGGRFDALVAHWEGAQICAAELSCMSLHDFAATALDGPNLLLRRGLGTLVTSLADGLPIRLGAPVARLDWGGSDVEASGAFGRIRARAAIITVSTGVLAQAALPSARICRWQRWAPSMPCRLACSTSSLSQFRPPRCRNSALWRAGDAGLHRLVFGLGVIARWPCGGRCPCPRRIREGFWR
jgi:monoamine oxidase